MKIGFVFFFSENHNELHEWTNEPRDERTDGRTNEPRDEQTDERTNRRKNEPTDEQTDGRTNRQKNEPTDERTNKFSRTQWVTSLFG